MVGAVCAAARRRWNRHVVTLGFTRYGTNRTLLQTVLQSRGCMKNHRRQEKNRRKRNVKKKDGFAAAMMHVVRTLALLAVASAHNDFVPPPIPPIHPDLHDLAVDMIANLETALAKLLKEMGGPKEAPAKPLPERRFPSPVAEEEAFVETCGRELFSFAERQQVRTQL